MLENRTNMNSLTCTASLYHWLQLCTRHLAVFQTHCNTYSMMTEILSTIIVLLIIWAKLIPKLYISHTSFLTFISTKYDTLISYTVYITTLPLFYSTALFLCNLTTAVQSNGINNSAINANYFIILLEIERSSQKMDRPGPVSNFNNLDRPDPVRSGATCCRNVR